MPLNIDIQQILLHMLNFAVLFCALYFILYKPVKKFMDKRNDYYDELEKKSSEKLEEAEKLKEVYEEKLTEFRNQEEELNAKTVAEARAKAEKIIGGAQAQAADIIAKSKARAVNEKNNMMKAANKEIKALAEEAAQKLIADGEDAYETFLNAFGSDSGEN